jgi:phage terminase large subunit
MFDVEFPDKLMFLINEPARYKVLYGGRGAGKTENMGRALIILASQKRLRILCCRELQRSIRESVHKTIASQIDDMGLSSEFEVLQSTIRSLRTGSEFIFYGLRHNINSIKSLARIDIAWVEEANNTSATSWDKLGPTIRGRHENDPNGMGGPFRKGPEIWVSFNPELDTDETYKRFVLQREKYAPNFIDGERYAFVEKLNWVDNKWFPKDLKRDMELLKATDEEAWLNVWEGHTKTTLDGAIYAKEIKKVLLENRRGRVAYDPTRPVHTFWDLGHADHTAIWFVQQIGVEYNLIHYYQNRLEKISHYLEYLQSLKYVYGFHYLPHDADNETLANRSVAKLVRDSYPKQVKIVPRVSKKIVGIRAARSIFELCNFDEEHTADGWQCLCRYQFDVDEDGQFSREPMHNEYSHGADAFQTFALSLKPEQAVKPRTVFGKTSFRGMSHSSHGWMNS